MVYRSDWQFDTDTFTSVARFLDPTSLSVASQTCRSWSSVISTDDSVKQPLMDLRLQLMHLRTMYRSKLSAVLSRCHFFYSEARGRAFGITFDGCEVSASEKEWRETERREQQAAAWFAKRQQASLAQCI